MPHTIIYTEHLTGLQQEYNTASFEKVLSYIFRYTVCFGFCGYTIYTSILHLIISFILYIMINIFIFSLGIIYLKPLNRNLAFGFHKNEHLHEFNRSDMFILLDMFFFFNFKYNIYLYNYNTNKNIFLNIYILKFS